MKQRAYQSNFYELSASVRSYESRHRQADKIRYLLTTFAPAALGRNLQDTICVDVGCSSGLITQALAPLFKGMVGIDYDSVALARITTELPLKLQFIQGDAMELPFATSSVWLVLCAQVYEHVPSSTRLFSELRRVLAPGGGLFFSGPNWLYPIEPHYFLPFLHWLPEKWADAYLRTSNLGAHYYERSRTWWSLRREFDTYEIYDLTPTAMTYQLGINSKWWMRLLSQSPQWFWRGLAPLLPNFNWLICKPH
jgi:SAM-dependent methyltransferase